MHGVVNRLFVGGDDRRHLGNVVRWLVQVVDIKVLLGLHCLLDLGCKKTPARVCDLLALFVNVGKLEAKNAQP